MPIIGTQQSPIEINPATALRIYLADHYLYPSYSGRELNGHFDVPSKNFVFDEVESFKIGTQDWVIRKIHFHDLAEHRFVGRDRAHYECHIVHTMGTKASDDPGATGPKLVLGTLFHKDEKAAPRPSAKKLNEKLKATKESWQAEREAVDVVTSINPLEFLPDRGDWDCWFRYEGSLTSEPFSEDVTWYVFDRETGILKSEVDHLAGTAEQEARPVHALDRRYVLRSFK